MMSYNELSNIRIRSDKFHKFRYWIDLFLEPNFLQLIENQLLH